MNFWRDKLIEDIVEDVLKQCPDDTVVKDVIVRLRQSL
jgi:hypothetical protein